MLFLWTLFIKIHWWHVSITVSLRHAHTGRRSSLYVECGTRSQLLHANQQVILFLCFFLITCNAVCFCLSLLLCLDTTDMYVEAQGAYSTIYHNQIINIISNIAFIVDCQCVLLPDLSAACVKNWPDSGTIAADCELAGELGAMACHVWAAQLVNMSTERKQARHHWHLACFAALLLPVWNQRIWSAIKGK